MCYIHYNFYIFYHVYYLNLIDIIADPESGKGLIIKELKQISCQENGMEVVLRMLIVPMEPEECSISSDSNAYDVVLDPLKQLVICWILGMQNNTIKFVFIFDKFVGNQLN